MGRNWTHSLGSLAGRDAQTPEASARGNVASSSETQGCRDKTLRSPWLVSQPGSQCPYCQPEHPPLSLSMQGWRAQPDVFVGASQHTVRTPTLHVSQWEGGAGPEGTGSAPGPALCPSSGAPVTSGDVGYLPFNSAAGPFTEVMAAPGSAPQILP